jgi:hypothetical protein
MTGRNSVSATRPPSTALFVLSGTFVLSGEIAFLSTDTFVLFGNGVNFSGETLVLSA